MNSSPRPVWFARYAVECATVIAATVLIAAVVAAAWLSYRNYSLAERESAMRHADDVALVLQAHAIGTLRSLDDALRRLKLKVERDGLRMDLEKFRQEHTDIADLITVISVADAEGRLVLSSLPIPPGAGIADLAHFRTHVDRDRGQLFINKPALGRVSGKWSFHLTRRINKPDGSFGGVVIIAVDLSYWDHLLQAGHFGDAGVIALVGHDGAARVVYGRNEAEKNALMQTDWTFLARAAERDAGPSGRAVVSAATGASGETWAYHEVGEFPLLVAVCVDEDSVAASLGTIRAWYAGGAIALVVLTLLLAAGMLWFLSRQRRHVAEAVRMAEAVRSSEERYRRLFDDNPLPVMIRDESRLDILAVNQAMVDKYGYSREQFAGMSALELQSPATRESCQALLSRSPSRAAETIRSQHVTRSGAEIEVELSSRPFEFNGRAVRLVVVNDVTAQMYSERGFRAMFDHAGVGISTRPTQSRDLPWLAVNDKFCEMTGYSREELLRMSTADITRPEDQAVAVQDNHRLMVGEINSYAREKQLICKGGRLLWVAMSVAVLRDADGRPYRVIATYQDIHARKLAEERLRDSEGRLRAIIAAEPECVATVTLDGRLLDMNPAGLRMLGAGSLEAMQRRPIIRHVAPEYRRAFLDLFHRIQAGQSGMLEFEVIGLSGGRCWLEIHAAPLRDAAGNVSALLGIARDVTERRKAREALAAERNLLETLINNIPDHIHVKDRDMRFILANNAWLQARSHRLGDVAGRTIREIAELEAQPVFSGSVDVLMEEDRMVLESGRSSPPREFTWSHLSQAPRWYVTTKSPLRDAAGNIIGLIGISRDVTDFKLRSLEVGKLNAALEQRVAERTAQLTNANEELEAFAASVSHDLRAPLRSLDGLAAMMVEDYGSRLDADGQHTLGRMRAAAARMSQLIEDLLRLSRVARAELALQPLDVGELAAAIVGELRRENPERNVVVNIGPDLRATADPGLLRTALMNLLQNAWKFTGNIPDACIEIGSVQRRGRTAFYVRDNGAGFDMDRAERLFGAFQRLHTDREFPGTGVGLATVRRVMRRHGGDAWAEAAVGRGAIFFFTLTGPTMVQPTVRDNAAPAAQQAEVVAAEPVKPPHAAVLLVDDDPDVLMLTSRALRPDRYEVLTVGSGEQAMEILRARTVDVIISDFSMPGMSGAQLLAQATVLHPATLRIIISGQTMNRAMQAGLRKGEIHYYFDKQQNYDAVRDCIRGWLARRASGANK